MAEGNAVYCDDCGREKMAEVRDGKVVIVDRRHGKRHVAVIPLGRDGESESVRQGIGSIHEGHEVARSRSDYGGSRSG